MSRALLACLITLGACALAAPSVALAGGPSAGDQQYIDPLAGSGHHGSSSSHNTSTTPSVPAPSPASSTSGAGTSTSSPASVSAAPTTSSGAKAHDPAAALPFTGFNALIAATVGACLLASGALLLRIARSG